MPRKRRRKPTHRAILFRFHPAEDGIEINAHQVNYHTKETLDRETAVAIVAGWEHLEYVLPDMVRGLFGHQGLTPDEEGLH